jgi:hypothetical protein
MPNFKNCRAILPKLLVHFISCMSLALLFVLHVAQTRPLRRIGGEIYSHICGMLSFVSGMRKIMGSYWSTVGVIKTEFHL